MDTKMAFALFLPILVCQVYSAAATFNECGGTRNVRLQGGKSSLIGRVEVCRDGKWQTVCSQRFNSMDARIVCRELGFSDQGARPVHTGFSSGSARQEIWLEDTTCSGTEETILDCPTKPLGFVQLSHCKHTNDVGVSCRSPAPGELRILGGQTSNAGRLEVYSASDGWGTVCDDYWSRNDAEVACRQLGFSSEGAQAVRYGFAKRSNDDTTPILLDNLVCTGDEDKLIDCRHNGLGVHNCDHSEDAGLVCQKKDSLEAFMQVLLGAVVQSDSSEAGEEPLWPSNGKKASSSLMEELRALLEIEK